MFYLYRQNSSFGQSKSVLGLVASCVIIEAATASDANAIAVANGLYFDGVISGRDCPCCGDRWIECVKGDGYKAVPVTHVYSPGGFVLYLSGQVEKIVGVL